MRCILLGSVTDSINGRIKYFNVATNLWMVKTRENIEYIELTSVPPKCEDICFIIGHRKEVDAFIKDNEISEHTVVLVTCLLNKNISKKITDNKKVYVSFQNDNYSELFDGAKYGFDFNITESEIRFYNNRRKYNIVERVERSFTLIE